jgi:flagellar biosynthesis GTPase FlhF
MKDWLMAVRPARRSRCVPIPALSADTMTVAQWLEAFADMQPDRLLLTKVDEAAMVMPLLDLALCKGLRISHLGTGQLVPNSTDAGDRATVGKRFAA